MDPTSSTISAFYTFVVGLLAMMAFIITIGVISGQLKGSTVPLNFATLVGGILGAVFVRNWLSE